MSRGDVRAAQMLIKSRLRWLEGYPSHRGSEWITLRGQKIELTPRLLRRSTRAVGELIGKYPHTLSEISDDPDTWLFSVKGAIDLLKPHVHRGEPLPRNLFLESDLYADVIQSRARKIADGTSKFDLASEVVSWTFATTPGDSRPILEWLESRPLAAAIIIEYQDPEWASIALARLGKLISLDGRGLIDPIERLYGSVLFHTLAPPSAFQRLTDLLVWSTRIARAERRRLFKLIEEIGYADLLAALDDQRTGTVPEVPNRLDALSLFGDALVQCAWLAKRPSLYRPVMSLFRQLPSNQGREGWPMHLLSRWVVLASWGQSYGLDSSAEVVLARLSRHLEIWNDPGEFLEPWFEAAVDKDSQFDWLLMMESDADPVPFFDAVSMLRDGVSSDLSQESIYLDVADRRVLKILAQLSMATSDPEVLAHLILQWTADRSQQEPYVDTGIARLTLKLTGNAYGDFWELYDLLEDRLVYRQSIQALESLVQFKDGQLIDYVEPLLNENDLNTVLSVGQALYVLDSLDVEEVPNPPQPEDSVPAWAANYPQEFDDSLALLSEVSPRAERVAERILGKSYPKTESLLSELDSLRSRIDTSPKSRRQKMQRRIENLEHRIRSPRPVTPIKRAKLQRKLQRAASRAMLDTWMDSLRDAFTTASALEFGLSTKTKWVTEQRFTSLVPYLRFSESSVNGLAKTLLQARQGPPPWDLRDHPANKQFVRKMNDLGIDMDPWLNGIEAVTISDDRGHQIHTNFEDDPLEIFHMGKPFDTCLSPGQSYFSSVLANAADVNKRVIMARHPEGSIVGRCLLALTDDGVVLSFHPYCTDPDLDFRSEVWEFVRNLCARMNTQYRPYSHRYRSQVAVLVAEHWLDDGPTDISSVFDETSRLRIELKNVSPSELPELLKARLDEYGVLELYLPSVIRLPEIAERPELAIALFPELRRTASTLPMASVADAASLLESAGKAELATQLLIPRSRELPGKPINESLSLLDHKAARLVAEHDPSTLLRILKNTRRKVYRGRRVTEWEEEFPTRAALAAIALEALNRKTQAKTVWLSVANQKPIGIPKHLLSQLQSEAAVNLARLSSSAD